MIVDDSVINDVFTYTSKYERNEPGKSMGSPGKKTFTVKIEKNGSATFRFVNERSWMYKGDWEKSNAKKWSFQIDA